MPSTQVTITLRLPPQTLRTLKDRHAQTYEAHRLSFNAWLLRRLCDSPLREEQSRGLG